MRKDINSDALKAIQSYYDLGHNIIACRKMFGSAEVSWAKRNGLKSRLAVEAMRKTKRLNVPTIVCPNCDKSFLRKRNCSAYCSTKCGRTYGVKMAWKQGKRKPMPKRRIDKLCPVCESNFQTCRSDDRKYCSKKCGRAVSSKRPITDKTRDKLRNNALIRASKPDFKGWPVRSKHFRSYAEKLVGIWLSEIHLNPVQEYKVGKWFIDFAFMDKMVALEIDGKQHKLEERMKKDAEKDTFLKSNGWRIIRIPWKRYTRDEFIPKF